MEGYVYYYSGKTVVYADSEEDANILFDEYVADFNVEVTKIVKEEE